MRCVHCNNEMEQGYLYISAAGSIPCPIIEWYSNEKTEIGFLGRSKRKKINIKDKNNGKFRQSYCCGNCKKVYTEYDI